MENEIKKKRTRVIISEYNAEVMRNMISQYGAKHGKEVYYATANKENRDPENFHEK